MIICDAQVHAPNPQEPQPFPGIEYEPLLAQMETAGVDRVLIVPMIADAEPSLELARRSPERFRVTAVVPLGDQEHALAEVERLRTTPYVMGMRVSGFREPGRTLLNEERLGWLFEAAGRLGIPFTINTMGKPEILGRLATRHQDVRFTLDHLGLEPFRTYRNDELMSAVAGVIELAPLSNVAVKATCLPSTVAESYPFPSLHEPLRRVIDAFTPQRVFWGSDLTRLPTTSSYSDCKRLFTDALGLSESDKDWIMGRGLCEWYGWELS